MNSPRTDESLSRLHRDLGLSPLSHWWGRAEMFLGLLAMGLSQVLLLDRVIDAVRASAPADVAVSSQVGPAVAIAFLFAFGGYLALTGHRRHLYESNNRLAAYLAGLVRPAAETPVAVTAPTPAAVVGNGAPLGAGLA